MVSGGRALIWRPLAGTRPRLHTLTGYTPRLTILQDLTSPQSPPTHRSSIVSSLGKRKCQVLTQDVFVCSCLTTVPAPRQASHKLDNYYMDKITYLCPIKERRTWLSLRCQYTRRQVPVSITRAVPRPYPGRTLSVISH